MSLFIRVIGVVLVGTFSSVASAEFICPARRICSAPVLNAANGHAYSWVTVSHLPEAERGWDKARDDSGALFLSGASGYLATITTASEQSFLASRFNRRGWIGGSDRASEGVWHWETGPEAGEVFWQDGHTVTYAAWSGGEPNNVGWEPEGEDYAQFNWGSDGTWNDMPINRNDLIDGYIVEFSPVPEPSALALLACGAISFFFIRHKVR